jgi:CRP-like cAMP-binding protein
MEQFLRTAAIFQSLSQTDMMPIANASKKVSHPANAPLFAERDPATHFYLVISGSVRLYRLTPDGKEKVIEIIRAGETFAESVALLDKPYPVFANTIDATQMIQIPAAVIRTLMTQNTGLAIKMLASLSLRVHKFINDIHTLSMSSAQQKVAGYFLAFLSDEVAEQRISLPSKKAIVASRLGLQPETFSRVLGKMKDQGVIVEDGAEIVVLQPEKLRELRDSA